RSDAYFASPLAQGTPGKQCGLAATGDYQPSLRSPWLAAMEMTTTPSSSAGFWPKIVFWLLIIIIGFAYVRSLAKHPGDEAAGSDGQSQTSSEQVTTTETTQQAAEILGTVSGGPPASAAVQTESAETSGKEDSANTVDSVAAETEAAGAALNEATASTATDAAVSVESSANADSKESASEVTAAPEPEAAPTTESVAATAETEVATATATASEVSPADDASTPNAAAASPRTAPVIVRSESVTRILKEFDDLRQAAEAEMNAMRNLIQAERELRDAMAPPPAQYRPGWGQGYYPYGRPSPMSNQ
ncbi:MAG: hypothetical protein JMN24_04015, partial [gamma proteobacterium endosymbiont of Lamellibrachia anaximandri]|nr:hypothetical protein [gamma proteobacterium endosymbiont of Lamellibrachia anaximandri]